LCWNTTGITVFGTGASGSSSDHLNNPYHLVVDSSGSFYIADFNNHRVQKFDGSSIGTTVAGQANGQGGSGSYSLNEPTYVQIDSSGNLYVSDSQNHRVQYFANGSLLGVTVAGTGKFLSTYVLH
jgi:DNA-binding beta-propeller fold protein YncE